MNLPGLFFQLGFVSLSGPNDFFKNTRADENAEGKKHNFFLISRPIFEFQLILIEYQMKIQRTSNYHRSQLTTIKCMN